MSPTLIALIIVFVALTFVWMLWLRQNILDQVKRIEANAMLQEEELRLQLDRCPIFLEKTKDVETFHAEWVALKERRTELSRKQDLSKQDIETWVQNLEQHLNDVDSNDWVLLDAREDLQESVARLKQLKKEFEQAALAFNALQKRFPWSVAFVMFGFRRIAV